MREPGEYQCDLAGLQIWPVALGDDRAISLETATGFLSDSELTRANRFVFARDRDRYIRCRGFLRQVLADRIGAAPADLQFSETGNGKPVLDDGPEFNLSHSRDEAVIALSDRGPVGVDIEFIDRKLASADIARACFTDQECAILDGLDGLDWQRRFFAIWTAKEARMKLTGEGMSLAPKSITLDLEEGWPVGVLLPQRPRCTLDFIELSPQVICCVARWAEADTS